MWIKPNTQHLQLEWISTRKLFSFSKCHSIIATQVNLLNFSKNHSVVLQNSASLIINHAAQVCKMGVVAAECYTKMCFWTYSSDNTAKVSPFQTGITPIKLSYTFVFAAVTALCTAYTATCTGANLLRGAKGKKTCSHEPPISPSLCRMGTVLSMMGCYLASDLFCGEIKFATH